MKKYLIHVGPGIGDIMQALPMARDIKTQEPDSRVDFIMRGTPNAYRIDSQILKCQRFADNLYWYSLNTILHDIYLLFQLLSVHRYDIGIVRVGSVTGSRSLWLYRIMRVIGCRKIIGSGYDKVDVFVDAKDLHYLEFHGELLKAAGITPNLNSITLNLNSFKCSIFDKLSLHSEKPIIGLSVGTNPCKWVEDGTTFYYDVKSWQLSNWMELAEKIAKKGFVVFLFGGTKEKEDIERQNIVIPQNDNIYVFIGKTNIIESLSLVGRCNLMVGSEGGLMHSAAAFGVKTLTIFGGTDPKKWNPGGSDNSIVYMNYSCSPCFITSRAAHCPNHKCLNDITVSMVEEKILENVVR